MARLDRGSKRVAKQTDFFFEAISKTTNFLKKYWIHVSIAAAVIIVSLAVARLVDVLRVTKENNAWLSYVDVLVSEDKGEDVSGKLDRIILMHPATIASHVAKLKMASELYKRGDYTSSMEYLQDLEKLDIDEPVFRYSIMLLKAKVLERMNKLQDAIDIYEKMMVEENAMFLGMEPYLQASIVYFKMGNMQGAVNTIQQGMMKFQKGYETLVLLMNSFYRMFALNLVTPGELN